MQDAAGTVVEAEASEGIAVERGGHVSGQATGGVVEEQRLQEPPKPDRVLEALRDELRERLEGPLDAAALNRLARVADAAGKLLAARNPHQNVRRRLRGATADITWVNNPTYQLGAAESDDGESSMAPSPPLETHGARVIRELVTSLPMITAAMKETPEALVLAIATARRNGMPDVAAGLEQRIGVTPSGERPVSAMAPPVYPIAPSLLRPILENPHAFAAGAGAGMAARIESEVELAGQAAE